MSDFSPLVPTNDLERTMLRGARGDADDGELFAALLKSDLLVPQQVPEGRGGGEIHVQAGNEVTLPVLPAYGRRAVPVYSSEAQMQQTAPPEWNGFLRLPMKALQQMLTSAVWLLINPGGDLSTMLSPLQVRALPEGLGPGITRLPADAPLTMAEPAEEDNDLLAVVTGFCRRHPEFLAAYRALFGLDGPEGGGRLAVGLLLEPEADEADALQLANRELRPLVHSEMSLLVFHATDPGQLGAC